MTQRTIVILSFALFLCTLVWGLFTFLVYLGVPLHQYVYLTSDVVQALDASCPGEGMGSDTSVHLCKGAMVLKDFLVTFVKMASPFFPYIFISALALVGFLLWNGYKTGRFEINARANAVTIVLAFILSTWLLGTTLALTTFYSLNTPENQMITNIDGKRILPPFQRFFEPTPQVYNGAGPEALGELQANYQDLLQRGCLGDTGLMTSNGAHLYDLRLWCIQLSMLQRVGTQIFMTLFFLFNLLVLGRLLLVHVIRLKTNNLLLLTGLSIGIGALGWVVILWLLGVFALLHPLLVRILFFGAPFAMFPQSLWWLKTAWNRKVDLTFSLKKWHIVLVWLLLTYLALNFLNVIRPFPIGWDDLGSYLNRPRLLASYGYFIPSMSQFQWEYLTSLGFLIFGYDSFIGSTFAMQINWAAGLIAALTVYAFARYFFGKNKGFTAAMLFYFLPMTGHFSFADMKIDNASFFTMALGMFAAFAYLFPPREAAEGDERRDIKLLLVAGLLLGFSFGIKPTAILGILMVLAVVVGAMAGPIAFTGALVAGFGVLQKFGAINVTEIFKRALLASGTPSSLLAYAVLIAGFALIGFALYKKRALLKPLGLAIGMLMLGLVVSSAPWALNNILIARGYSITGYLTAEDKSAYLSAAREGEKPEINVGTMLSAVDTSAPQVFQGQKEEAEEQGFSQTAPVRYLPPDLKLDLQNSACIGSARTEELDRYWGFGNGIGHYFFLPWRQVMNSDSYGYYVTLAPILLLFPLLLLLPYFWSREGRWLRLLFVGTSVFLVEWAFSANGVPWYGIGMFLGLAVGLEAAVAFAPDHPNRWLWSTLIGMSILICLVNRFWQFDTQKNLFEYPLGKITATALREVTIPQYDDIRESVVTRHETLTETPYTYRIGTFISYFIPRNREIFPLADHQLNFFNCLNQEQNHALTLKRLQALGFNSMIFDTNTDTIEKDPQGPLHQKVSKFKSFINDPLLNLNVVVDDPGNGIAYILLPSGTGSTAQ